MENFSLLVQNKYNELNPNQQKIFVEEYNRRKKPFGDDYNSDLALIILRDIALDFGNNISFQSKRKLEAEKIIFQNNDVNSTYSHQNKKSKGMFSFSLVFFLIAVFVGVSLYLKPNKAQMQNDIINKFLETQPQFLKFFKDSFLGKEISEEKADILIYNILKISGHEIYFKDSDFVIVKKLEILNQKSNKPMLKAYGFMGKTFITFISDDLVIDFNRNSKSYGNTRKPQFQTIENVMYEEPKKSSPLEKDRESSENRNMVEKSLLKSVRESELVDDSIKIN